MLLMKEDQAAVPRRKPRIMYLDFDLHYGDGVASAFHSPTSFPTQGADAIRRAKLRVPQVLTLSIHHSSRAFYPPPTPLSQLPSPTTPHLYSLSMPLHAYPSAKTYAAIWPSIQAVHDAYKPDYVVLQLGADGLPSDPVGQWGNWSTHGVGGMLWVAQKVKEWSLPLCVLGGGGYNNPNTARAWAGVTSVMVSCLVCSAEISLGNHWKPTAIYHIMTTFPTMRQTTLWGYRKAEPGTRIQRSI